LSVNLLVLGPQGAGKGTQAKRISAEYGVPHVSTGDMFRAAIAAQTELGRQVEPLLASGTLVPDAVTIALIRERLAEDDAADGFVLDGFPRNLAQARVADHAWEQRGIGLEAVVYLEVPEPELRRRLLARAHTEQRSDDTPEVIANRLALFAETTFPLVEHYRDRGLLVAIAADQAPDAVTDDVLSRLSDRPRTM
jgi:adenylate kinase